MFDHRRSLLEDLVQNEGDYERMGECFISRVMSHHPTLSSLQQLLIIINQLLIG